MPAPPGDQPLRRWEKAVLALAALGVVAFGVLTEVRSCFLETRHTDFTVYVRAAWAARAGHDLYAVADEHAWHYCYPPTFALLLTPLADPPPGEPRDGYPPLWLAAGLWVVVSTLAAIWAVHVMARAVLPDAVPWTRRWWYARTVPLLVCAGGTGFTISRGQVNTVAAALIAGGFAAWAVGRRFGAGAWLAAAAALKVTPGLLVLHPLIRGDRRVLAGFAAGAVVLLLAFPATFFGFGGAVRENLKVVDQVLAPGTTGGGDRTRAEELTDLTATDSSSFQVVIHNWQHPVRWGRPPDAPPSTRLAHWAISGAMLAATLLVIRRRRDADPADQLVLLGSLVLVMLLMSPVSHTHHFAMALPAASGLWLRGLARRPGVAFGGWRAAVPLCAWGAGVGLLLVPGEFFLRLREFGLGTAVTLLLWGAGLASAWRKPAAAAEPAGEPIALSRAARAAGSGHLARGAGAVGRRSGLVGTATLPAR
jgi:hypothetical protein